jgi:hypothetical protein
MHTQRTHLRAVPLSPTRGEQENTMNRTHQKSPPRSWGFEYGQVVSQRVSAAHLQTNNFYCLDADTATAINLLAKTINFPDWQKQTDLWFHSDTMCVSEKPHGWLASRRYRSHDRQLTHQRYLLPILFPTAGMAQAAVQLCLPTVHPALGWRRKRIEQAPAEFPGLDAAFGWMDWTQVLPKYAWLYLAKNPRAA